MKRPISFGKYYLLERINVGGMAEVFKAKAFGVEGFERMVAVKRILPNIAEDEEFISMFIDEAKIAVQLNHANIAQIFDLGKVEDSFFIALEYIHGKDLRGIYDRCRTQMGGPMSVAQASFVIMKTCEGLDYAHNKRDSGGKELNLVHRDVSPQNILVSYEGEVKIIDFGIAKAANKATKTQAGILKGKFGYMSPEQVRGLGLDRRSDIFSLGIILYEMLTGERLFLGESDFSTLEKVRNVEILPPSTYNRKIPEELERIVLRALAKDAEDRYQNAIDLHDELQAFLYSAGEFYSRKDLAAWMKKTFAREIEEETRKNDEYRKLAAPPRETPAEGVPAVASRVGRRPTAAVRAPAGEEDEIETSMLGPGDGVEGAEPIDFTPAPAPAMPEDAMAGGMAAMPEERRRPPWLLALAALLLLCVAGGGVWWFLGSRAGTLHIASEPPDVRVFVDGVAQPGARTPMTLSVKPGAHEVRLWHPDHQAAVRTVNVPSGGAERVVVRLDPVQGAGFLIYSDPPGASVVLDDQPLPGATPMRVSMVSVGKHRLEIKKEGFRTLTQIVEAKRTEQVRVDANLPPTTLTVKVESRPSGAKVYLNDGSRRFVGETPLVLRDLDASGVYLVTLERSGCESWSKQLRFDGRPPPAIDAALSCRTGGGERVRPQPPRPKPTPMARPTPPKPTGGAIGFLKINCKPWAKIIIDGRDTSLTTPQLKIPLAVGRHRITLDNPSFGVRKTLTVEIAAGETNVVLEDLRNQ